VKKFLHVIYLILWEYSAFEESPLSCGQQQNFFICVPVNPLWQLQFRLSKRIG
jgi:hypothetical protein